MQLPESLNIATPTPPPVPVHVLEKVSSSLVIKFLDFCKTQETEIVQCCVFLDEHNQAECIPCHKGHYISQEALQPYVVSESEKTLEEIQKNDGLLKCPMCPAKFLDQDLAVYCTPETYLQYTSMRTRYLYQQAFEQVCADMAQKEVDDKDAAERLIMHEAIRNQFKNADGTFGGWSCPRCLFGPIDKLACDDLKTHHNQVIKPGVTIRNCCPMCFFHAPTIAQWTKWEGKFLEGDRLKQTSGVIDEIVLPFEKFKEDTLNKLVELEELKKSLGGGNVARQCFLAEISSLRQNAAALREAEQLAAQENVEEVVETNEEEEIQDDGPIDDPEEMKRSIDNSSNVEERQIFGSRMIAALRKSKKNLKAAQGKNHYEQVCADIKLLNDSLISELATMEANVATAVENLSF